MVRRWDGLQFVALWVRHVDAETARPSATVTDCIIYNNKDCARLRPRGSWVRTELSVQGTGCLTEGDHVDRELVIAPDTVSATWCRSLTIVRIGRAAEEVVRKPYSMHEASPLAQRRIIDGLTGGLPRILDHGSSQALGSHCQLERFHHYYFASQPTVSLDPRAHLCCFVPTASVSTIKHPAHCITNSVPQSSSPESFKPAAATAC